MLTFVFLGPPGVGKGTMAEAIGQELNLLQLSTGQVLREEIQQGSDLGKTVKQYVEKGEYAPDEIVIRIVANYIDANKSRATGVILDGFPRTLKQAESLTETLQKQNLAFTAAVLLEADTETIVRRLTGRRMCRKCGAIFHLQYLPPKKAGACDKCGGELYQRADDGEATVRNRLQVYAQQTQPLIAFYDKRQQLVRVDANGEKDANLVRLRQVMKKFC